MERHTVKSGITFVFSLGIMGRRSTLSPRRKRLTKFYIGESTKQQKGYGRTVHSLSYMRFILCAKEGQRLDDRTFSFKGCYAYFSDQPEKGEEKELSIGMKADAGPNRYSCNETKRLPRIQQNICGSGQPF